MSAVAVGDQLGTTAIWRAMLGWLIETGDRVSQDSIGAGWRGRTSLELVAYQTRVPMSQPVLLCPNRKLSYPFLAAEAAMILGGDNRVETIRPYASRMAQFSDDGRTLAGAYGPPFVDQIGWVTQALARDPFTRQALMTIWRPRPGPSADIPCTVALQWLIRPSGEEGAGAPRFRLHCSAYMRSSDAWMGWPYDVHAFSMMSAYLLLALRGWRNRTETVPTSVENLQEIVRGTALGELRLTAGSQHLYLLDAEAAHRSIWEDNQLRTDEQLALAPFNLDDFTNPDELVEHLWLAAGRHLGGAGGWLAEALS